MLPQCTADVAEEVAARLRMEVSDRQTRVAGLQLDLRVSIGMTTSVAGCESLDALVASADAALYEAKNRGRNRVVAASDC